MLGAPQRRDRLGWLLFALSMAALPFVRLALRRPGRLGGLLVDGGVGILLVRAIAMVVSGAAAGTAFVLHTVRMAIYLSPGRGLREGAGDQARRS